MSTGSVGLDPLWLNETHLFVAAVPRQDEGAGGVLRQNLLRLLHAAAVDVPLDELNTNTPISVRRSSQQNNAACARSPSCPPRRWKPCFHRNWTPRCKLLHHEPSSSWRSRSAACLQQEQTHQSVPPKHDYRLLTEFLQHQPNSLMTPSAAPVTSRFPLWLKAVQLMATGSGSSENWSWKTGD